MGVVYKLRENVIDFIVQQKKDDPLLSCRQLAQIINEKFQIHVSKSSVNAVIKTNQLSSSVGRKPIGKPKKFQIPLEKKAEFQNTIYKLGFKAPEIVSNPSGAIEQQKKFDIPKLKSPHLQADDMLPLMKDPIGSKEDKVFTDDQATSNSQEKFLDFVNQARAKRASGMSPSLEGMGIIFLKAALWQMSGVSFLTNLFKKHHKQSFPDDFENVCETLLLLIALGVESAENIERYKSHALFALQGLNFTPEIQKWFDWLKITPASSVLIMEYLYEQEQGFSKADQIKLFLEDKSEILLDIQMSSLSGDSTPQRFYWPMSKAMTLLSNTLISNNQSIIFRELFQEKIYGRQSIELIKALEGVPGKRLERITVSYKDNEMASFSIIPVKKRFFMAGVFPWQKEFKEMTKTIKWVAKRPFYHDSTNRVVYFTETTTDLIEKESSGLVGHLKVITIWEDQGKDPVFLMLTNSLASAEDIIHEYISRWPNFVQKMALPPINALNGHSEAETESDSLRKGTLFDIFAHVTKSLTYYWLGAFSKENNINLDVSKALPMYYIISGSVKFSNKNILVRLDTNIKDLNYFIAYINENHVLDSLGRKLFIEIYP